MQSNVFSSCSSPINYLSISCIDNPFKSKDKRNLLPTHTFVWSIEQDNSDQQTQPPPLSLASDTILGNPNSVSLSYNQLSFSCRKVKSKHARKLWVKSGIGIQGTTRIHMNWDWIRPQPSRDSHVPKAQEVHRDKHEESVQEMVHLQHNSFSINIQIWHGINIHDAYMRYSLVISMHKQNIISQEAKHKSLLPRQLGWSINAPIQLKDMLKAQFLS